MCIKGQTFYGGGRTKNNVAEAEAFSTSAEHLFAIDFYRALARGAKPIVNNEHYCIRVEDGKRVPSRKEDIVTSLWTELFHGSSGCFAYCWDKRSWEWKTPDEARQVAEAPSYKSASLLNPWNYPPESLDGFRQFMDELEPLRDAILPMPRTTPPSVAVFFSYPTLRMLDIDTIDYRARLLRWYGAILGAHYPLQIVFEEDLVAGLPDGVRALVVPAARYATPDSAAAVRRFAARGGVVVAAADAFLRDERGDLKLLLLVDMGARQVRKGTLKWNVADDGRRYRLTDAATGNAIQNGDSGFCTARDLVRGIAVMVSPQTRLLLRLDAVR